MGDYLYAVGIANGKEIGEALHHVHKYDPESDAWTKIAAMNEGRLRPEIFTIDFPENSNLI